MRYNGTVKWFHKRKGWGFITPENGMFDEGEDAFVHYSQIEDDERYKVLEPEEQVSFELVESERGPMALRVRKET